VFDEGRNSESSSKPGEPRTLSQQLCKRCADRPINLKKKDLENAQLGERLRKTGTGSRVMSPQTKNPKKRCQGGGGGGEGPQRIGRLKADLGIGPIRNNY